jgi:hypothetical protein
MQSMPPNPISLRSILLFFFRSHLGLPSGKCNCKIEMFFNFHLHVILYYSNILNEYFVGNIYTGVEKCEEFPPVTVRCKRTDVGRRGLTLELYHKKLL